MPKNYSTGSRPKNNICIYFYVDSDWFSKFDDGIDDLKGLGFILDYSDS